MMLKWMEKIDWYIELMAEIIDIKVACKVWVAYLKE